MDDILANIMSFTGGSSAVKAADANLVAKVQQPASSKLGIVCFSKGRPYQLHQLLLSMETNIVGDYSVSVIVKSASCEDLYAKVFQLHPAVQAIEERDFDLDLKQLLLSFAEGGISHVMFCVDDLIFIDRVSVR